MKRHFIFLFLLGLTIGLCLDFLFSLEGPTTGKPYRFKQDSWQREGAKNIADDVKKIRVFCFLNTSPASHSKRAVHILNTWSKHCDKLLFASTLTDVNLGALGFNVSDDHGHMWGKEKLMLQFIHKHYLNDYDWFFKGDDDTFLIAENLRFMLSTYSTEDPIYFGYKFNTTKHKRGYFSGGAGYVMSRKTVKIFVEQILVNRQFFHENIPNDVYDGICHLETDDRIEDWEITTCLDRYNVYAGDGRDIVKRERFLMWWPEAHLLSETAAWYTASKYYWSDEGLDCCSNYTISFHYMNPRKQYTIYYLTYRLLAYGIKRRFPKQPKKYDFSKVSHILDRERFNKSLRSW